jgi:hypothetical protein
VVKPGEAWRDLDADDRRVVDDIDHDGRRAWGLAISSAMLTPVRGA